MNPGSNLELLGLRVGGCVNRFKVESDEWTLSSNNSSRRSVIVCEEGDTSSDSSWNDDLHNDDSDTLEFEEVEDNCLCDLKGNRILNIAKLVRLFEANLNLVRT